MLSLLKHHQQNFLSEPRYAARKCNNFSFSIQDARGSVPRLEYSQLKLIMVFVSMSEIRFQPQTWALTLFAIMLSILLHPSYASGQGLGIAAIVNDDVISLYDLEERLDLLIITSNQKDSVQLRKRLSRQTLNHLIDEKLKLQDAKKLGINDAFTWNSG